MYTDPEDVEDEAVEMQRRGDEWRAAASRVRGRPGRVRGCAGRRADGLERTLM